MRHGLANRPEQPVRRAGPTICELFQRTARAHPDAPALTAPDGRGRLSWREYRARVERSARGLAALGVQAGDTVGLMLVNRPEFHILDVAAMHLGATPFSLYNTSSPEQIEHVLGNAGCRVLVCEREFAARIEQARRGVPALQHVVVLDGDPERDAAALEAAALELAGAGLAGTEPGGAELDFERCWRAVAPDAIATIIYTSGTTGPPKGVELSHANLLAAWESSVAAIPTLMQRGRYVSYLPAAHLADRMFSHYPAIITGSEITCVADPRGAVAQLPSIRPTLFLAVPRIWEKLKDAIEAAIEAGLEPGRVGERFGLSDALLVSGAAPIRRDVLEFYAGLGLSICEGYGMTESTAVATLNLPGAQRFGTVGPPLPGVQMVLAEDGEVLLRGPGVMVGYRRDPERTAEAVDVDGWLHTGDVGRFDGHGYLEIVDRKKELIINAAGKNMSPANIEAHIKAASPLVAHAIAIGDDRPYNTALLVLDADMLALHAQRHPPLDVTAAIRAAVAQANTHLSRVEQIKRFTILDGDWAPGGQELTPTLKLKRRVISEQYAEAIEAMYGKPPGGHEPAPQPGGDPQ